jgi:hypothetical protein
MREFREEGDVETIGSPKAFEEKVALAKGVMTSFERALRTSRLYKPDHPIRRESIEEIQSRFRSFFEKYSYLRLDVTQSELKLEGRVLMKCEPREPEAPFRLYKDGIREIRFHRGLERDELFSFMSLLEMDARDLAEIELDLVSLLWSKDFKTIDYVTIDEFEMAEGESEAPVGTDLLDLGKGIRVDMATLMRALAAQEVEATGETSPNAAPAPARAPAAPAGPTAATAATAALPAAGASAAPSGPAARPPAAPPPEAPPPGVAVTEPHVPWKVPPGMPRPAPAPTPMTPEEVEALFAATVASPLGALREAIEEETMGAAIIRTIALLSASFSSEEQIPASELGPLLRGLLDLHCRKGDFARVGRLMRQLGEHELLDRVEGGADLWRELAELIQAPEPRKLLLTFLNSEFADDIEGLEYYLEFTGPGLVQDCCAIYGRVKTQKIREVIRDYIKAHGRSVPIAFKGLLEAPDAILTEVFDILRYLKPSSAAVELDAAFDRLPRAQKFDAITIATTMEGVGRVRIFKRALADPDITLRTHALKKAGEAPAPDLQAMALEWIEREDFAARVYDEKLLAYRTYVRLAGPAALAFIKEVAGRKPSLFGGPRALETRRAAVLALASLRTPAAHLQLEEWSTGGDRALKEYAAEALKASV